MPMVLITNFLKFVKSSWLLFNLVIFIPTRLNLKTIFMKKLSFLIIAAILLSFSGYSQKADFRAAEKFSSENIKKMLGSTSVRANWLKDSDQFWYSYKTGDGNFYWFVNPSRKTKEPLFDNNYLCSEINQQINKILNPLDPGIKNLKFKDEKSSLIIGDHSYIGPQSLINAASPCGSCSKGSEMTRLIPNSEPSADRRASGRHSWLEQNLTSIKDFAL